MASTLVLLPLASAAVSGVFAAAVLRKFLGRRRPHQLAWTGGLVLFTLTSLLQASSEAWGWSEGAYRLYYPSTAVLVGLLGLGTLFLLGRPLGLSYLAAFVPLAFGIYALAAFTPVSPPSEAGVRAGGEGMGAPVRYLGLAFTIPGSVALIGGALLSWWRTRRSYNLLIAVGTAVLASGGSLARFGIVEVLYVSLLVGIAIMFVGFLRSQEVPVPTPRPAPAAG